MPYTKRIVVLANSRKPPGRCVAGKEILENGFGGWVRPVSDFENGGLSLAHIMCKDGKAPNLLDVVTISFKEYKPNTFQIENYLNDETKLWIRELPIDQTNLPVLLDNVETLWINGDSSKYGRNDRIPEPIADQKIKSSLVLIKPGYLVFRVGNEYDRRRVRASFEYHGTSYLLMVTDPVVEGTFLERQDGLYPTLSNNIYLCISLGEPYKGFTYKLVAGVINFPLG